jgi:hypothetical protein
VPTIGARYSLPGISKGSWAAVLGRYDFDIAGDNDRGHLSELQLAPLVNFALPDNWFVNLYPSTDIRINLGKQRPGDEGSLFLPFNLWWERCSQKTSLAPWRSAFPSSTTTKFMTSKWSGALAFSFDRRVPGPGRALAVTVS